jgi:hypothetical protein
MEVSVGKDSSSGASLIAGLIMLGFAGLCLAGAYAFGTPPEDSARVFLAELGLGPEVTPVCVQADTDGDLYVSCTARDPSDGTVIGFECHLLLGACRMQKARGRW